MCRPVRVTAIWLALFFMTGCSSTKPSAALSGRGSRLPENGAQPPVYLNYVSLTLDVETCEAINQSQFIRDHFCLFGQSTTMAGRRQTWSATYLLGQNTCVELFAPGGSEDNTEGNSGICFSTCKTGDINIIYDRLRTSLGEKVHKGLRTFNTGAEIVPWFRYVSSHAGKQTPALLTWVIEHDPGFHKAIGHKGTCRAAMLPGVELAATAEREYAGSNEQYPQRLFRDITGVTLVLTQTEFEQLAAELLAYGYVREKERSMTVFTGPGIQVRVAISSDPKYRIRSLRCSLTRGLDAPAQMNFGDKATLTLTEDGTGIWTFGPRAKRFARN